MAFNALQFLHNHYAVNEKIFNSWGYTREEEPNILDSI